MKIPPSIAGPAMNVLYRLWCKTLRITESGRERIDVMQAEGVPMMFPIWHDEIFGIIAVKRQLRVVTIVSQSQDGEYLARVLESIDIKAARGSTSRGAISALLQAARIIREEKRNGCISVDGPRGPRHEVKQGAVILAFRTPAWVVPLRGFCKTAKVFKSWDRFQLPLPFSRVHIHFDEPYQLTATALTEEEVERERQEMERRLKVIKAPKGWGKENEEKADKELIYLSLLLIASLFTRLPWKALRTLANGMAFCFWHCVPSRRKVAIEAIRKHLKVSHEEASRIARQSFRENFLSFFEIFHTGKFFTDQSVKVTYTPEARAQLEAEEAPIVIATAHLGSWELMPGLSTDLLPKRESMVVVRKQKNKTLNRLMAKLRGARGMLAVDHRQASEMVVPKLRKKGVVAFLVDHNTSRKEAVFLPFLEDTAAVNMGPASIALRTKAAVYPVFLLRDGEGGHILHMLEPLHTKNLSGSIQERIEQIAAFYTDAVASMVRQYPEQWFWMHKRWKTRSGDISK